VLRNRPLLKRETFVFLRDFGSWAAFVNHVCDISYFLQLYSVDTSGTNVDVDYLAAIAEKNVPPSEKYIAINIEARFREQLRASSVWLFFDALLCTPKVLWTRRHKKRRNSQPRS